MNSLIEDIEKWAEDRGLDHQSPDKQIIKLTEEVGELAAAHNKEQPDKVVDSVGDILVVITVYCQQSGLSIQDCLEYAYEQISGRKGKLVNGVFIKEEDLK